MKKLISLLLTFAMVFSFSVVYAETPKISGTSVNAKGGDTVRITFNIKNNPGVSDADIMLVWDSKVLSLTDDETELGDVFANGDVTEDRDTDGRFYIIWNNTEDVAVDGDMFTVTFKIEETAKISNYFISIGVNNFANLAGDEISTSLSLPNVAVIEEDSEEATEAPTATPTPTSTPTATDKPSGGGGGGGAITTPKPTVAPTENPTEAPTEAPSGSGNGVFEPAFTDITKDDWYYDSVKYVYTNGLMNGTSDTEFAPNVSLTRAMLVTVLWRLENEPVVNYVMPFEDIVEDVWYAEAVRWASAEGIVNGVEDTKFAPDNNISREQIATIMYRYAEYKDIAPTGAWAIRLDYSDLADISDYATDGVMYCKLKGIMQGKDNNNFAPQDNATRAEIATILQRFIETDK